MRLVLRVHAVVAVVGRLVSRVDRVSTQWMWVEWQHPLRLATSAC